VLSRYRAVLPDSALKELTGTSDVAAEQVRQTAGIIIKPLLRRRVRGFESERAHLRRRLRSWRNLSDTDLDCLESAQKGDELWTCELAMVGAALELGAQPRDMLDLMHILIGEGTITTEKYQAVEKNWSQHGSSNGRPRDWRTGDTIENALRRRYPDS